MSEEPIKYTKDIPPDLEGPAGKAWKMDGDSYLKLHPEKAPIHEVTTACWILQCPAYHPVWHSYVISCVSLKNMEGLPPAVILLPNATHELFVIALNPNFPTTVNEDFCFLEPINFSAQFIAENDEVASGRIEESVKEILAGVLSPDTDFMSMWVARYGDSNLKREYVWSCK